jgi:hypothetical protein
MRLVVHVTLNFNNSASVLVTWLRHGANREYRSQQSLLLLTSYVFIESLPSNGRPCQSLCHNVYRQQKKSLHIFQITGAAFFFEKGFVFEEAAEGELRRCSVAA